MSEQRAPDPERHPPLAAARRAGRRRRARPSRRGWPRRRAVPRSRARSLPPAREGRRCSANGPRPTTPRWRASPPAEVAGEVAAYLARNNLPAEAAMAPSPAARRLRLGEPEDAVAAARPRRGQRPGLDHRRLRRHRRDRHAGDGVGPRPSGDAQPPARHPYRGAAREPTSSAATRRCGRGCARATARTACRAPSTPSPARRAPATSSRPSSSARTGRGACTSWWCANEAGRRRAPARRATGGTARRRHERRARGRAAARPRRRSRWAGARRASCRSARARSVSDRNERNWRSLVAKRFGSRARFVGIDLLEGTNVDQRARHLQPARGH